MKQQSKERLSQVIISPYLAISEAIAVLDRAGIGILLLCDVNRKLVGVLTDGDIRRALLQEIPFTRPCQSIAGLNPIVARFPVTVAEAIRLMDHSRSFVVNQLPVVDQNGVVVDLLLRRDLVAEEQGAVSAVIMAGGFGMRLRPLTAELPKPMLPLGDRPLLELTIRKLQQAGIQHVNVTTHYLPDKITEYFGNGDEFGIKIDYVQEDRPLGTAGALSLLATPTAPLLVINGDIVTQVDFRAMVAFHRAHQADLTVGVRQYEVQVPYGVMECDGLRVKQVREKPTYRYLVNAGIYLLEPTVHHYVPKEEHFDMPDLITRLIAEGRIVVSFPIVEYWLDIGQHEDYLQAQADVEKGRVAF